MLAVDSSVWSMDLKRAKRSESRIAGEGLLQRYHSPRETTPVPLRGRAKRDLGLRLGLQIWHLDALADMVLLPREEPSLASEGRGGMREARNAL